MPKGGRMLVPMFLGACFVTAVIGVLAWIYDGHDEKEVQEKRTSERLECASQIAQLKSMIESFKSEVETKANTALIKAQSAEAVTIELKDRFNQVENKATAAADLSHRALLQTAKPQTIKMEGSLKIEREKVKPEPRRSP